MKKIFTKEVKIAVVAIVSLVALFFGMNFLKGVSLFSSDVNYKMTFSNIKGLTKNTAIYADGFKVGSVSDIIYDYNASGPIIVEAALDKNLRVPAGSQAKIESDLMGNIKVTLLLANNPRERIPEGGTIVGIDDGGLMGQVQDLMPQVQQMMPKVDSILSAVNNVVSSPAIGGILNNTNTMTSNANALVENLRIASDGLNSVMNGLNSGVPSMMNHANNTMANAEQLSQNLAQMDLDGTMRQVKQALENVEALTKSLSSNDGTLGKLMNDPSIYNNLNSAMQHADSLLSDLKNHPKRYVHFSIFGKKDK